MRTWEVALQPENEAPRAVCQDRRGTTNYVNSSNTNGDTTAPRSAQHRSASVLLTAIRLVLFVLAIVGVSA